MSKEGWLFLCLQLSFIKVLISAFLSVMECTFFLIKLQNMIERG